MKIDEMRRTGRVLALWGLAACAGCIPVPVILPGTHDFSGFEEFEFSRDGICSPSKTVRSANIRRDENGRFQLEMSVLEEGIEGIDECDPNFAWWGCLVVRDLPPRELTAEEAAQLQAIFNEATVETVFWYPFCAFPCEIRSAHWDDFELTDHKSCSGIPMMYQTLSYAQMDEIIAFLETLSPVVD